MFKHIILALAGNEPKGGAVRAASEMAAESAGEITVVHVRELAASRVAGAVHLDEPARLERVRREVADLERVGIPAKLELYSTMENPARVIAGAALSAGADVIVTGASEHHGISSVTAAGVPRKLLRLAPCPVLTVLEHHPVAA